MSIARAGNHYKEANHHVFRSMYGMTERSKGAACTGLHWWS